jgi:hypothetical protein
MTTPPKRKVFRRTVEQRRRWSRNANAAKARYRMERPAPEREPKMLPWHRFKLGVRDTVTGETAWTELRSVRDAARRLAVVLRYCQ